MKWQYFLIYAGILISIYGWLFAAGAYFHLHDSGSAAILSVTGVAGMLLASAVSFDVWKVRRKNERIQRRLDDYA